MAQPAKMAIARVAFPASTGDQDITVSGFGTVKAAIITAIGATSGVVLADTILSFGATDGTNRFVLSGSAEDNVGTTNTKRQSRSNALVNFLVPSTGSTLARADIVSFITDGIRINWSTATATPYIMTVTLFGGDDVEAAVNTVTANAAQDVNQSVTGLGFAPDAVLGGQSSSFGGSVNNTFEISYGWAADRISLGQSCVLYLENDNQGTSEPRAQVFDNRFVSNEDRQLEMVSLDSDGFTFAKRMGGGNISLGYLALRLGRSRAWAGSVDSPTSTASNWVVTAPGFTPDYVNISGGLLTTVNDVPPIQSANAGVTFYSAFTPEVESCVSWTSEDNVGTTNTSSRDSTTAVLFNNDAQTTTPFNLPFVQMTDQGWELGTTAADSTVRKWAAFAIGQPTPDTRVATAEFAAPLSSGTQDFTISGFGSVKAYLVYVTFGITDGVENAGAVVSSGHSDGTRQHCMRSISQDGLGTSNTNRQSFEDRVIQIDGAPALTANHDSFITDGVRLNFTSVNNAHRVHLVLFGGDTLQVYSGNAENPGPVNNAQDVTDPGFRPDVVFFVSNSANPASGLNTRAYYHLGFASDDGSISQGAVLAGAGHNQSTSATWSQTWSDRVAVAFSNDTTGGVNRYIEYTNTLPDGFENTLRSSGSSFYFSYLALRSIGNNITAKKVDVPTGTGNQSITGIGFKPKFMLLSHTLVTTEDSQVTSGVNAGSYSQGFFDQTRSNTGSIRDRDGVGTTVAKSRWDSKALYSTQGDGTTALDASFAAFNADGVVLNFVTNTVPGAKMVAFAVEEDPAVFAGTNWLFPYQLRKKLSARIRS